jgi:hypothetical protein
VAQAGLGERSSLYRKAVFFTQSKCSQIVGNEAASYSLLLHCELNVNAGWIIRAAQGNGFFVFCFLFFVF